jgi:glycerol-3-phosphate dehydrogenase
LVNAAGPWAGHFVENVARLPNTTKLRLVKGSHVVLPRLHAHDRAYLLQHTDGRVVFVIPFAGAFTLIGTTDVEWTGDPSQVAASSEEILYLCRVAGSFFRGTIEPSRITWVYAGVRALVDDGRRRPSEATRDYRLDLDAKRGEAPLLSVYGGKLTTYRSVAAQAVDRLGRWLVAGPAWTHQVPLPGGDLGVDGLDVAAAELRRAHPFVGAPLARRLVRAYGSRAAKIVSHARRIEDLGPRIVSDLHAAELDYLRREEWARTAEDVLWRRTKLGLVANDAEVAALNAVLGTLETA